MLVFQHEAFVQGELAYVDFKDTWKRKLSTENWKHKCQGIGWNPGPTEVSGSFTIDFDGAGISSCDVQHVYKG